MRLKFGEEKGQNLPIWSLGPGINEAGLLIYPIFVGFSLGPGAEQSPRGDEGGKKWTSFLTLLPVKCGCAFLSWGSQRDLSPNAEGIHCTSRIQDASGMILLHTISGRMEKLATQVIFLALWFR